MYDETHADRMIDDKMEQWFADFKTENGRSPTQEECRIEEKRVTNQYRSYWIYR